MAKRSSSVLIAALAAMVACGGDPEATDTEAATAPLAAPTAAASEGSAGDVANSPAINRPPRIDSLRLEPEEPTVDEALRVVVDATDEDGDMIFLDYTWTLDGETIGSNSPKIVLHGAVKGDRVEVSVRASDGQEAARAQSARTEVRNSPPYLQRIEIEPGEDVIAGEPIVARPLATDADGDALSFRYEWTVNDRAVLEEGSVLETTDLKRGDRVVVEITASDRQDKSEPRETPAITIANAPPRIVSHPREIEYDDGTYRYRVRAEDPDGDTRLQFGLENEPEGMTVDAQSGVISWRPTASQAGKHTVAVFVDDLQGGRRRQTFELFVRSAADDSVPAGIR